MFVIPPRYYAQDFLWTPADDKTSSGEAEATTLGFEGAPDIIIWNPLTGRQVLFSRVAHDSVSWTYKNTVDDKEITVTVWNDYALRRDYEDTEDY